MIRKLKALGLALFAVCALGAVAAQGASASGTVFTGKNVGAETLQVGGAGTVSCATSSFEGTVSEEEEAEEPTSLTLKPTPSECTFGGQPATVKTNDCAYVLGKSTNAEGHADLEIECAAGHQIEIDTFVCTVTIGPQLIKGAVHYEGDTASSFIAKITAKKVKTGKAQTTEGQKACALVPTGEVGTYNATQTVECLEDTSPFPQGNPTTPGGTGEGEGVECPLEGA